MQQLPQFQSDSQPFQLLQSKWASILNPILANPFTSPVLLKNITLTTGDNVINHKLGQKPQGWLIVDTNAGITVYRSAAFNDLTLTLNSSGSATITLAVF